MRLIGKLKEEKQARHFATILQERMIDAKVEPFTEKKWGSSDEGDPEFQIWIVNEDDVKIAKECFNDFVENPDYLQFLPPPKPPTPSGTKRAFIKKETQRLAKQPNALRKQSTSFITLCMIAICTMLTIWTETHKTKIFEWPTYIPPSVVLCDKLQKSLLFDYPEKLEVADKLLLVAGGPEPLLSPAELPEEERLILDKFNSLHIWKGLYPHRLHLAAPEEEPLPAPAPMFEKIKDGEIWRIFTPALLHSDVFHLLFNMLWLAFLGTQIEARLGIFRYLLLILISGISANIAQYLMSGYWFVGFSGVVAAMIAFIWMRKRKAPWEGYLLEKSTILFISIFIFGLLGLQIFSFFLQAATDSQIAGSIANSAHIIGGLSGALLAATPFGRWKGE